MSERKQQNKKIPQGWSQVNLENTADILDSRREPINSKERQKRIEGKLQDELYPYYGATGQVGWIDDYLFDGEFVLVGEDGAPFLDYSKDTAYIVNGKIWVNNHAHIIQAKGSNKFLCYYLNQVDYRPFVTGTTRLKLNQSSLRQIPVKLPPLPEQKRIVARIEELFSTLDNGVANLQKAREQLNTYRQSVLKAAFEGRFGKKTTSQWSQVNLEEICKTRGGYAFRSKNFKESGKYQVIRIGNLRTGNIRLDEKPVFRDEVEEKVLKKYLLKEGDVIISLTGTRKKRDYGYTAIVNKKNLLLNQRLAYLRFNKDQCLPKFFHYYSRTRLFKDQFFDYETGNVGQGNVSMKALRKAEIPLPSLQEQQQIVREIESRLSVTDQLAHTIETTLQKAESLRQSILKSAFEGRLVEQEEAYQQEVEEVSKAAENKEKYNSNNK